MQHDIFHNEDDESTSIWLQIIVIPNSSHMQNLLSPKCKTIGIQRWPYLRVQTESKIWQTLFILKTLMQYDIVRNEDDDFTLIWWVMTQQVMFLGIDFYDLKST